MTITDKHIRAAGGIVHADGNIFFTSLDKLNAAVRAALMEVTDVTLSAEAEQDLVNWVREAAEHKTQPVAWPDCWVVVKDGQIVAACDEPGRYDGIEAVRYTPSAAQKECGSGAGCLYKDACIDALKAQIAALKAAPPAAQPAPVDRSGCSAGTDDECTNRTCARACPALATPPTQPAPVQGQEPVYLVWLKADCAWIHTDKEGFDKTPDDERWMLYTTPPAAPQQPPRFPTMLRKMWSGAEVQAWIDEHWHSAQPTTPAIPSGWTLTLDGQHIKLTSPESRWWDFGPNTDGPDRLVWEFLSAMRDGASAQKGEKP